MKTFKPVSTPGACFGGWFLLIHKYRRC